MNQYPMREVVFTFLVLFLTTSLSLAANSPKNSIYHERVYNLNTVIDVRINHLVEEQIDLYIDKRNMDSRYILGRTALYFPKIENALREKGLPDELKYIAVIESSLRPDAVSHQGATGLWQFMKGTALIYGMEVNKYIDERKDVDISTEKALVYLKTLYNIYGNWTTALAAYNCGDGNVNKAIKRANGSTNYWDFVKFLPKETREYIPRFIAASYLMNYYYLHDITPIEPSSEIKFVGAVKVFKKTHLREIHEELGVDFEVIKALNPIYVKNIIPANKDGKYHLILPEQAMISYLEKNQSFEHLVYLSSNTTAQTTSTNDLSLGSMKDEGTVLLKQKLSRVFSSQDPEDALVRFRKHIPSPKKTKLLKRKETLADLAQKNNLSLEDLMILNDLNDNDEVALHSNISIQK